MHVRVNMWCQDILQLGVERGMIVIKHVWSLPHHGADFWATCKSSVHEITERKTDPELCQYAYAFCKSGFTSSVTMKYWREQDYLDLSIINNTEGHRQLILNSVHPKPKNVEHGSFLCQRKSMKVWKRWLSHSREKSQLHLLVIPARAQAWQIIFSAKVCVTIS